MMARDDMAAVQAVRRCRQIVEAHVLLFGGRLFGAAGDSFMVEFPDAEGATRCATAIQKDVLSRSSGNQQLLLRGGIDAGSVIDDDGNLYGDAVNVAARLQEVCPPGGVLVSRVVHDALVIRASFRSAGELSLKNIATPVEIFEVMDGDHPLGASANDLAAIDVTRSVPGFEGAPVLAVLPLENRSDDAGQEHVCRGFSEDLIIALSRMRQFTVIDRSSTFTHVSYDPGAKALGRRLGARYLLEGALQMDEDRFGISMQLTDLESGRQVWSDWAEQGGDERGGKDGVGAVDRKIKHVPCCGPLGPVCT